MQQGLRVENPSANAATAPVGCVRRAPSSGTPELVPAGNAGCTASDHLEIDYDNGDQVNVTWIDNTTSFDLLISVVAGPWTGTNLHYQGSLGQTGATVNVSGAMKYSKSSNPVHIDADFNLTYAVSGSQSANGATVSINVSGTATDHIALVRANEYWTLRLQTSSTVSTEQSQIDWTGGVGVDLLKADGQTTDHSVAFNLNLRVTTTTGTGTSTVTWAAGGDVDYDGAIVGNVVSKSNVLYVDWTDGTESEFDPSSLLASFGV
jgi:hypothetical protein